MLTRHLNRSDLSMMFCSNTLQRFLNPLCSYRAKASRLKSVLGCFALSCLSSVSFSANAQVDIEVYQRYQMLSQWLTEEVDQDIAPIQRFYQEHQGGVKIHHQLASSLYLQACLSLDDLACALQRADELLGFDLPMKEQLKLNELIIQLAFDQKDYSRSWQGYQAWLLNRHTLTKMSEKTSSPLKGNKAVPNKVSPEQLRKIHVIAAYSAYRQQQWQSSEEAIQRALSLTELPSQDKVKDYRFLLSVYQQSDQLHQEFYTLKQLVVEYPNELAFWRRIAQSALELGRVNDAMTFLDALIEQQRASTSERLLLAQLYLQNSMPNRAAILLQQSQSLFIEESPYLERYRKLWLQSLLLSRQREQALKLLSQMNDPQHLSVRAQLTFSQGHWQQALPLLDELIKKESIKKESEYSYWQLLKGMSWFELQQYEKARAILSQVPPPHSKQAKQWLEQIDYLTQ